VVSDWFQTLLGVLKGLCPFPEKRLNLNTVIALRNGPAMKPKHTKSTHLSYTKKQYKATML